MKINFNFCVYFGFYEKILHSLNLDDFFMSLNLLRLTDKNYYEPVSSGSALSSDESKSKVVRTFREMKPKQDLLIDPVIDDKDYDIVLGAAARAKKIVTDSEAVSGVLSAEEMRLEVPIVRVNRCLALFNGGQIDLAMKWARSTNPDQKVELCNCLIDLKYYNHAAAVARLMGPKYKSEPSYTELKNVCRVLNNKKQYDLAVELILEIPSEGFEFYFLEECQYLIEREQCELAKKLAMSKLDDSYKYKLCAQLTYEENFEKVVEFAHLIDQQFLILRMCKQLVKQGQNAMANELSEAKLDSENKILI